MGWLQLAGAGISALSQEQAGKDAAAAARADAALKVAQIRKLSARTQSEARAATAAAGVDVNSPSAKAIQDSIESDSQQDAMTTIMSGGRVASTAEIAGRTNALGTLIGAAGSQYGQSALGMQGASSGRWRTAAPGGVGAGGY